MSRKCCCPCWYIVRGLTKTWTQKWLLIWLQLWLSILQISLINKSRSANNQKESAHKCLQALYVICPGRRYLVLWAGIHSLKRATNDALHKSRGAPSQSPLSGFPLKLAYMVSSSKRVITGRIPSLISDRGALIAATLLGANYSRCRFGCCWCSAGCWSMVVLMF